MKYFLGLCVVVLGLMVTSIPLHAEDEVIESYVAKLSARDHRASDGYELTGAAEIIRQDRANYHKFQRRDEDDERDQYFASEESRNEIQRLLAKGGMERSVGRAIVNGTPLVEVSLWRRDDGVKYLRVAINGR